VDVSEVWVFGELGKAGGGVAYRLGCGRVPSRSRSGLGRLLRWRLRICSRR
jgi:hypothetical protein